MNIHCKYDSLVNPKDLKNHPKNRNKHGQDQVERLSELYKYHGIRHPIIVSKQSGFIVAGHGRKLAAIRAGVKEMPVVYQEFESSDAEYAFIQSDNAIASWAELDLSGINTDIGDLGPDFDINMLGIRDFTIDLADKSDDLSNMEWDEFLIAYREIIKRSCDKLKTNSFACFVVGEIRDNRGNYRDFVGETVQAFVDAGLSFYNEAILINQFGTAAMRANKIFSSGRKLIKCHQNILVFIKGDAKAATKEMGDVEAVYLEGASSEQL